MKAVHFRIFAANLACNYNRWKGGSCDITSTRSERGVTCKRCLAWIAHRKPLAPEHTEACRRALGMGPKTAAEIGQERPADDRMFGPDPCRTD